MAWLDEYPHSLFASVLLLDNKIEMWKIGNYPKSVVDFSGFWKLDRLKDYTSQYKEFIVYSDKEHNEVFEVLAHEWFKQWEIADDFVGGKPY